MPRQVARGKTRVINLIVVVGNETFIGFFFHILKNTHKLYIEPYKTSQNPKIIYSNLG